MKKLIFALTLLFILPICGYADDVSLEWNHSISTDVVGYKVYYGTESRTYGVPVEIGYQDTFTVSGLSGETEYFFAVTAFDEAWNESIFSNEVSTTTPDTTPPEPPNVHEIEQTVALDYADSDSTVSLRITKIKRGAEDSE